MTWAGGSVMGWGGELWGMDDMSVGKGITLFGIVSTSVQHLHVSDFIFMRLRPNT